MAKGVSYGVRWTMANGNGGVLTGLTLERALADAAEVKADGGEGVAVYLDGVKTRTGRHLPPVKLHDV